MSKYDFETIDGASDYFCQEVMSLNVKDIDDNLLHDPDYDAFQNFLRFTRHDYFVLEVLDWIAFHSDKEDKDEIPVVLGFTLQTLADNPSIPSEGIDTMLALNTEDLALEAELASCENLTEAQALTLAGMNKDYTHWSLAHNSYAPHASKLAVARTTEDESVQFELLTQAPDYELRSLLPGQLVANYDHHQAHMLLGIANLDEGDDYWDMYEPTVNYQHDLLAVLNSSCPEELVVQFLHFPNAVGEIAKITVAHEGYEFQHEFCTCEDDE